MSNNLEKAKIVAEQMLDLNFQWIDAQEVLTEQEEREFIEWQKNNPKWIELPRIVMQVRMKKMQIEPNNNQ